ncbi:myosin light chain kinase, smooth muscle [Drosophila ficusphila]|uniref:myosin light chain kinase, smooth muscle n=1 Tax=Drosophila ficusphila TaxID=30025 RepID=UPI0007E85EDC|nr:myosin light chain kinase, smooth muscle [Drosophila ficusphila]XP_017045195.1 myosin light chain kinase, smooth muscle [Drosophila ficusphila]XP_017045196.1 myosin light chain kinase, smooth muscle [Drosophila ficusphila]
MIYIDDSEPEGVLEPAFPMRDVTINRNVDAHKLYDVLGEVGRGKFGTVYKCKDKANGLQLAAKFVPIPKREDKRNVEREVEIMNSLQHHLIIQLYAAYEYQKMMCVVLELIEGGELFDRVVDDEFVLTERVCRVFIRQVCEAMAFIHGNGIVHLDLKPENILVLTQKGNRIKIIDFGLARKFDPDKRLRVLFGTPEFVAPEVVNFDCISYGTDMWSVGVICYVLISGLSPFMGENDIETMSNVTIAKYDFEDECFNGISPECLDFIAKLLAKDLSTRMTAAECMKHKWLQQRPATAATATPITKAASAASKSRLKSVSPVTAPSESSEDSTETIEDEDDEEEEVEVEVQAEQAKQEAAQQDEELAKLCSSADLEDKELDATKDNLKNFIVRWETHPNSPYVFDVEGNVIAPLGETSYPHPRRTHGQDSLSSSRVCSPSPCESIATLTDDERGEEEEELPEEDESRSADNESPHSVATPINESREKLFPAVATSSPATPTPQHLFNENFDEFSGSQSSAQQQRSMKSYLHTFDRRNSDTTYLLGRRSSGERVNLADEIRKLSDHLLMLAEINTKLGDANNNGGSASNSGKSDPDPPAPPAPSPSTPSGSSSSRTSEVNQEGGRWSSKSTASSSWSRPTARGGLLSQASSSSWSQSSYDDGQGKTKVSSLSVRLQQSIEETPKLSNGSSSASKSLVQSQRSKSTVQTVSSSNARSTTSQHVQRTSTTSSKVISSSSASASSSSSHQISTSAGHESASSRRAKFRINQMSRDVPVGLPDTHQTVNLEEAANTTKDCLLHLLEKYNETRIRSPMGRHQSISVDWHVSDNLEYRSMSSINAFFQRHNHTGGGHNVRHIQAQLEEKAAGK